MMRVSLLAPVGNSLYSRLVAHLVAKEADMTLTGVVLRTPWSWPRIRGEMRRDGPRLLEKAYEKLVLGDDRYTARDRRSLRAMARREELPGKNLAELARTLGVPLHVVKEFNRPQSLHILKEMAPDIVVSTGGGMIRKALLDIPRIGVLNCHMGALPAYRGMDVVEWSLVDRPEESPRFALTAHFMDAGLDTGPILRERYFEIEPGDDFSSVRMRLEAGMVEIVLDTLRRLRHGTCIPRPQRIEDGRQFFVMHPRIMEHAERVLERQVWAATHGAKG